MQPGENEVKSKLAGTMLEKEKGSVTLQQYTHFPSFSKGLLLEKS